MSQNPGSKTGHILSNRAGIRSYTGQWVYSHLIALTVCPQAKVTEGGPTVILKGEGDVQLNVIAAAGM